MVVRRALLKTAAILALSTGLAFPHAIAAEKAAIQLFDTHVHFVSDDLKQYPISTAPANPHEQMMRDYQLQNFPTTAEKILRQWDANNVAGGVGVQYRTAYGTNNSYLLDTAAKHAERVATVVILNAVDPATPDLLYKLAREHRIAGVRFTGGADAKTGEFAYLDAAAAQNTWAAANELGLAVVLMYTPALVANPVALERIARMAGKYPKVQVVLDHIGFPAAEGAPHYGLGAEYLALKAHRNIYYKFTEINVEILHKGKIPTADFLRHAVDVYGADRIMWGSDFGNTKKSYSELIVNALAATGKLKPDEQRQVLHDTGKAVFGAVRRASDH